MHAARRSRPAWVEEHLRRRWCRFISGAVDGLARHGGLRMYLKEFYHEKGTRTAWPYVRWHRNRDDGPPEPPLDGPHYGMEIRRGTDRGILVDRDADHMAAI